MVEQSTEDKIRLGISSCLTGEEVRFNGGHKHSRLCTQELAEIFSFTPICPEVGIGLGIPRKPIRLVGDPNNPRAVGSDNADLDVTDKLKQYAERTQPLRKNISGYIFIKGSPSCGLFRVKVYNDKGIPQQDQGRGIYARMVTDENPLLPVEESGRLEDPVLRENFITRVFAYNNWQKMLAGKITTKKILDFHTSYKYMLMAHHLQSYTELGQFLADAGKHDPKDLAADYFPRLMNALNNHATRKTHTNVLMHLQGYLKKVLSKEEKESLVHTIEQYRKGIIPLIVPVVLLKSHFKSHPDSYISQQAYLQPYPDTLSLRNRI